MDPKRPSNDFLSDLETAYAEAVVGTVISPRVNSLSHAVIGAAIEVHRHLGPGFNESAYEAALVIELNMRGISTERQKPISLEYKEQVIWTGQLDLLVESELVVELKAVETILPLHRAQAHSYLRATGLPLALLLNFNVLRLREGIHRVILKS